MLDDRLKHEIDGIVRGERVNEKLKQMAKQAQQMLDEGIEREDFDSIVTLAAHALEKVPVYQAMLLAFYLGRVYERTTE